MAMQDPPGIRLEAKTPALAASGGDSGFAAPCTHTLPPQRPAKAITSALIAQALGL